MAYYVKIDSPREFRRDVLEASKKVIGCLQANRNVQFIRQRKLELLQSLQDQIKELALLVSKFDELLPNKELREEALQRMRQLEEERKQAMQRALEEKRVQEEDARRRAEEDARQAEESRQAEDARRAEEARQVEELPVWHGEVDASSENPPVAAPAPDEQLAPEEETPEQPEVEEDVGRRSEADELQSALASIEKKLASLE